jgi:uncharacterized protein (TIGR01777 family)
MKTIVIAGGAGFLGRRLTAHFQNLGCRIIWLVRSPHPAPPDVQQLMWDGKTIGPWAAGLNAAAAVINLAGRSVNCRYNARNRALILDSRVQPTLAIGQAVAQCPVPPPVWLNASTATIYRHTFGPAWTEDGSIGSDLAAKDAFSVEVATRWEAALDQSATPKTRKIALRTAMVLGCDGNSVFPTLRRLTRLGLGGPMAGGRQFVSWIHETDFCRAIAWLIADASMAGPVNVAAPNPVTNAQMMQVVRQVCGRRFGLPAPGWLLEWGAVLMQTETELIIKSRRVVPQKLLAAGFEFRYPQLQPAIQNLNELISSTGQQSQSIV